MLKTIISFHIVFYLQRELNYFPFLLFLKTTPLCHRPGDTPVQLGYGSDKSVLGEKVAVTFYSNNDHLTLTVDPQSIKVFILMFLLDVFLTQFS